jgi:hypothetical protein
VEVRHLNRPKSGIKWYQRFTGTSGSLYESFREALEIEESISKFSNDSRGDALRGAMSCQEL